MNERPPYMDAVVSEERVQSLRRRWDVAFNAVQQALDERGIAITEHSARAFETVTFPKVVQKFQETGFLVLSSVAGGGKSTVGKMVEALGIERIPRVTTRAMRPGENDGHDYEFMSHDAFINASRRGEFVYEKSTYGEKRAIRKSSLDRIRTSPGRYYAEGDAFAYHEIRTRVPGYENLGYASLFILPPSFDVMLERLFGRIAENVKDGGNPMEVAGDIEDRLEHGIEYLEMAAAHVRDGIYDGFIANDDLDRVRNLLSTAFDPNTDTTTL